MLSSLERRGIPLDVTGVTFSFAPNKSPLMFPEVWTETVFKYVTF